jgi:hypothetical protein
MCPETFETENVNATVDAMVNVAALTNRLMIERGFICEV